MSEAMKDKENNFNTNSVMNEVILGDCLNRLDELESESVDLIYLDPPFYTQKEQKLKTRDNSTTYSFDDKWQSIDDYKKYITERLHKMKRVLKNTGSIFLHCDKSASHYLRVALDEVFGYDNFQSEIIWSYKRWSNAKKGLLNSHQTIYFYSKTKDFKFNKFYTDYSATTNVDQILQKRVKDEHGKSKYMTDDENNVVIDANKKGVPLGDVWEIPYLNPKAKERTGYPTQKPILLLEQIIKIVTDEKDVVLDPFCGSGTTLVASSLLNRSYIGIDRSEDAIELSKKRLEEKIKTESHLLKKGVDKYKNKTELELQILSMFNAITVQRNKGIDGFINMDDSDLLVSLRIQKENENLSEAIKALRKSSKSKKCSYMVLVRTSNECIPFDLDNNILIIDKFDLAFKNWIERRN